ncbi:MAG: tetratricopeptide repeat protein [Okeania sp. SIO2C9]|uniref:tetratricopeptide repeat-containing sulfotransferase family protein n=1 Tax=Okeania sp. SIO2C9 TaxID=2607791 RepID=UPI0013BF71FF|nr:tetratricopeptide repeat-containing sulfotransferase family protein [Okeania sp. SIO2C9]NEQ73263.1 tetratricopeptide repeat protein [Okeania sp. SIO2C9]
MSNNENQKKLAINLNQIAASHLADGKLNEAYAACLQALNSQPEFAPACKTMGDIFQAQGDIEAAKNYYNKAIQILPNFAEAHANLGSMYAKQQEWERAISTYEKALKIQPNLAGVYRNLAKVWHSISQEKLGTECNYQAVILEPESLTATEHLNLGNKLLELDKIEAAINCYRNAIKINPNLSAAYQELGEILSQNGELEEALVVLKQGIKFAPKNPRLYYLLGTVFQEKKEYDSAHTAYSSAIKLKPENHLFHKKLGDIFQEKGELEQAIACYQKSLEISPNFFWGYYSLGNIYIKQQRWDEAIYVYHKSTIISPKFSGAYYKLADAFLHNYQKKEAINAHLEAVRLRPEHSWFSHHSVLWNNLLENRLEEVLNLYQNATKIEQNSFFCHLNLGEIFTKIGNIEAAIRSYKTACYNQTKKINPTFVEKHWNFNNPSNPNFIIIGSQKSGTTSLANYINQHPQVLQAIKKETHFWSGEFHRGIDWYLAHFPSIPQSQNFITGEATPNYLVNYKVAERIYSLLPDIKLFVILRNPVYRAFSQYHHWQRLNWEDRSFEVAINQELEILKTTPKQPQGDKKYWQLPGNYIGRGVYIEFIQKWMEVFPREQFLILRGEDLYQAPDITMKQVFDFLGLPEHKLPKYKKLNSGSYAPISDLLRQKLSEYFQPHNQRLEKYLGMKFNW